ncbi:hypothetical protein GmHk_15G045035 [Glycine max]|uniref:Uncharacterized protein n=1 Tax=Glycine max TaxID=3847 RepID=A0A0R0GGW9_SOYBN|nr:hypothetical protein GYH30_043396 [Glycine max]KAH1210815.1 hypothetical protein GmHk_15G045035 [Glycine max]
MPWLHQRTEFTIERKRNRIEDRQRICLCEKETQIGILEEVVAKNKGWPVSKNYCHQGQDGEDSTEVKWHPKNMLGQYWRSKGFARKCINFQRWVVKRNRASKNEEC